MFLLSHFILLVSFRKWFANTLGVRKTQEGLQIHLLSITSCLLRQFFCGACAGPEPFLFFLRAWTNAQMLH